MLRINAHRAPRRGKQWSGLSWERMNWAQRFAELTGLTPADLVTGAGVGMRVKAAYELSRAGEMTRKRRALWLGVMAVGNLCDFADGAIAERLEVKHQGGATADAVCDGISMTAELIGLYKGGLIKKEQALMLAGIKGSNAAATYLIDEECPAVVRQSSVHGKWFVALAGAGMFVRAASVALAAPDGSREAPVDLSAFQPGQGVARHVLWAADTLIGMSGVEGVRASAEYWGNAWRSHSDLAA